MRKSKRISHFFFVIIINIVCLDKICAEVNPGEQAESTVLELETVINSALKNHPLIKGVEEQLTSAQGEILSAQGAFDPQIKADANSYAFGDYSGTYQNFGVEIPLTTWGTKLGGGYRRGGGTFPVYDNFYETNDNGELSFGVEIPLLKDRSIDKRRATIEQSLIQKLISVNNIDQRKIEIKRTASFIYWDWVAAKSKKEIFNELLAIAETRGSQLKERVKSGDLPQFDELDNQRIVLQRKAQLISAEALIRKLDFELSLFYRDDDGNPIDISKLRAPQKIDSSSNHDLKDIQACQEIAVKNRPELGRIRSQIKQTNIEIDLIKNQLLPKLDLQAVTAKDYGSGSASRDEGELKAGIKFEVPLFMRTQRGKLLSLEAKNRELVKQQEFTVQRIETDVKDAVINLAFIKQRLNIVKEEVLSAKILEEGERSKFELGDSNLIFINLREQTTADAKIKELDAIAELKKGMANYQAAIGDI